MNAVNTAKKITYLYLLPIIIFLLESHNFKELYIFANRTQQTAYTQNEKYQPILLALIFKNSFYYNILVNCLIQLIRSRLLMMDRPKSPFCLFHAQKLGMSLERAVACYARLFLHKYQVRASFLLGQVVTCILNIMNLYKLIFCWTKQFGIFMFKEFYWFYSCFTTFIFCNLLFLPGQILFKSS